MADQPSNSAKWTFTRPDPPSSSEQYFQPNLRNIATNAPGCNLPWRDDMYLAYPSTTKPDWPDFVAHIKELNDHADSNTHYKIVYVMRRAHKVHREVIDPEISENGKDECAKLLATFKHAVCTTKLPPPEVLATSPLARALNTAELAFPSLSPIVLENLRETLDGRPKNMRHDKAWIASRFPTFDIENVDAKDRLGSNQAASKEDYAAVWRRVQSAFEFLFEAFPTALVVGVMSHCHVIQTIQREISGFDLPSEPTEVRKDKVEFYLGDAGMYAMIVKGVRK
ncbi:hypothetical protein OPT61_g8286 [Boeremia exigua]|uniref:Uncharacterized protein n=1 Tax=Boeremia exigua TaxID=749465 RepID=A0ACC2HYW3_9PLEO|nr:hypothetical protein OPT61_g8286 [Boeremia exigua]